MTAGDAFTIHVGELNTFAVKLHGAAMSAPLKADAAIHKTAHDIEGTAKLFVPVDTGATKNSIHVADADKSGRVEGGGSVAVEIGPTTHYAPHLEYGTVNMAPHAFMGPALDIHAPDLGVALGLLGATF